MVHGKYFYIESKMCGLVADIADNSTEPGAAVNTWTRKDPHEADNQLWYRDGLTGTIRSKLSDFCLDVSGEDIVVNPYQTGDNNQQWDLSGDTIRLQDGRAMDIAGACSDPGSKILAWEYHGNSNQEWRMDYIMPRYFFIKSEKNEKVLDVADNATDPGSRVVMWGQSPDMHDNQLWYEADDGTIRSKHNDLCLDATNESQLQVNQPGSNPGVQLWQLLGNKIVNRHDPSKVFDIRGDDGDDGAEICIYDYHGNSNQHWSFEYV